MIKTIAFIASLVLFQSFAFANTWTETGITGYNPKNSKSPVAVFVNSYPAVNYEAGTWHRTNMAQFGIPPDVKWVMLTGILIITHGVTPQQCDLTIAFRAPGDNLDAANYIGQTVEASTGNGQRSNMTTIAPVVDGEIEWQWRATMPQSTWPSHCSYGINLSLQAYGR